MDNPDPDPLLDEKDTREFFFEGSGLSVLLIHGLTGTPYEMRYLGERLANAGIRVHGVRLAGHGGAPEELGETGYAQWYESVVEGFERLRTYGDPNVVIGLSMGALLAARLASEQPEAVAGLVMLSAALFLPPRQRIILRLLRPAVGIASMVYVHRPGGSDIHDAAARRIHPGSRLLPLRAPLNLMALSAYVRPKLARIEQPALVIHSRKDHVCPFERNAGYLMRHLGSQHKRLVELDESFHVITVDSEKERVAGKVLEFASEFRVTDPARAVERR
jgi:carboxylesterase